MENNMNKTFAKVLAIGTSALIAIFAGIFWLISLSALFISLVEKDFFSVIVSGVCAFLGWVCWSVRKDVL